MDEEEEVRRKEEWGGVTQQYLTVSLHYERLVCHVQVNSSGGSWYVVLSPAVAAVRLLELHTGRISSLGSLSSRSAD